MLSYLLEFVRKKHVEMESVLYSVGKKVTIKRIQQNHDKNAYNTLLRKY